MTTATLVDTDVHVRDAVMRQLDWDPGVDASAIGVTARSGVVTLTGYVDSYAAKLAAERAAKRVRGVRAVANDVAVRLKLDRTDSDIAADAARALEMYLVSPKVQAVVHSGHVTLTGIVEWIYQKREAEKALRHVRGVRHVRNLIAIAPRPAAADVRDRIAGALRRNASVDAARIRVTVEGDTAVLTGSVPSWPQRDAAEHAAGDAPGIAHVDNRLAVEPPRVAFEEVVDPLC